LWPGSAPRAGVFSGFRYPTLPLHLTAEDARRALEAAGWFSRTGSEVTW
jgi:hypothetical protein